MFKWTSDSSSESCLKELVCLYHAVGVVVCLQRVYVNYTALGLVCELTLGDLARCYYLCYKCSVDDFIWWILLSTCDLLILYIHGYKHKLKLFNYVYTHPSSLIGQRCSVKSVSCEIMCEAFWPTVLPEKWTNGSATNRHCTSVHETSDSVIIVYRYLLEKLLLAQVISKTETARWVSPLYRWKQQFEPNWTELEYALQVLKRPCFPMYHSLAHGNGSMITLQVHCFSHNCCLQWTNDAESFAYQYQLISRRRQKLIIQTGRRLV